MTSPSSPGVRRPESHELPVTPPPGRRGGELAVFDLLERAVRHRRILLVLPLVLAGLFVVAGLLRSRQYSSTATFLPQQSQARVSGLAGLAADLGVSVPFAQRGQSPEFYADLLRSREILRRAAESEYRLEDEGTLRAATLVEAFRASGDSPEARREAAIHALRSRLSIRTRERTGVVEVSVTTPSAKLSRQVAERLLQLLNQFDMETRRTQAAAERTFTEDRLAEARNDLQAVEDSLQRFLQDNRRYENSPELQFRYQRLQHRVQMRRDLVTALAQSHERAKIEEVRNTPVITVVEPPEVPVRPQSRRLVLRAVLGLVFGGVLGLAWAWGSESLSGLRRRRPEAYRNIMAPVRGLTRRFRHHSGTRGTGARDAD